MKPIPQEKRRKIIHDYFYSHLMPYKIAKKHKVAPSTVARVAQEERIREEEKDYAVLKIESKWIGGIKELLDRRGIPYEIPEHFELTEIIESKINKQA